MKQAVRILASSLIWAVVIITTALTLKGTTYLQQVLPTLGGGATSTMMIQFGAHKKNQ